MNYWVWVFGDLRGLSWVREHSTMAFAGHAMSRISNMRENDQAVLYVTANAYRPHDESRVVGLATVMGRPEKRAELEIAGREFSWFCPIRIDLLLKERTGPLVRDLVEQLQLVRFSNAWGGYFRPSPVSINAHDFHFLESTLKRFASASSDDVTIK